jgi:enoyl-CoA hydratase/carnithine racemase
MYSTIMIEQQGAIDWLTLNRPDRFNAITGTMVRELWDYFSGVEKDYSRRVIVMRGAGKGFCAGLDIKSRSDPSEQLPEPSGDGPSASLSAIIRLMRRCPQPIIALIHGPACGGGLAFALAADVRIAGTSARMNDAFIKLGISGCELGLSYFLPRMVGLSVAAELMFTGRFIEAGRALAVGLVSDVVADDELENAGRSLAGEMLKAAPFGLRKTKETLNLAMKLNELDAVIDLEEHTQLGCMQGGDFEEAMKAFVEKREPRFAD